MTLTSPVVRTSSISSACHEWTSAPGSVAPRPPTLPSIPQRNKQAIVAPTSCKRTYPGTRLHGKSRRAAKASVTAGFKWAPDTAPMKRMIAITIRPGAVTAALRPMAPLLFASTTAAPAATSTRKKVPKASANRRFHWRLGSSKSARDPNSSAYHALARSIASGRSGARSDAGLCSDTPLLGGILERGVVALVLVRVSLREPAQRPVEHVAGAEVGRDCDRVAGAGVRLRERPATQTPVLREIGLRHRLDRGAALRGPELPDVEVVRDAVSVLLPDPTEQDVARGLDQTLALDDALTVVRVGALPDVRLEDRGSGLLGLQEERVVPVAAEHQDDPGAGPDASHADDLACSVHVVESLHQLPAITRKRSAVVLDHAFDGRVWNLLAACSGKLVDGNDQRRIAHDPAFAVDDMGQLRESLEAVLGPRLRKVALQPPRVLGRGLLRKRARKLVDLDAGVPEIEGAHGGEVTNRLAVGTGHGGRDSLSGFAAEPALPTCNREARGQAFEVPLEGSRKRLVEVVDVERQPSIGRCEDAEIGEVCVAAELRLQARPRPVREIRRHDRGRASEEGERRNEHSSVANRHELRQPRLVLLLEHGHGIGPGRRRRPVPMRPAGHVASSCLATRRALRIRGRTFRRILAVSAAHRTPPSL